jgi:heme/copper-type cytochrome/quinol oxidase subunit 3
MDATTLAMPRHLRPVPTRLPGPVISNTRIAMAVVIAAESMFFAGLIGTYMIFRLSAPVWPPADLPRLPLGLTALNSLVLLASVVPITSALRAARRPAQLGMVRSLAWAVALGGSFLAVQGLEWIRLVRHGLTLGSSMYGATFYVLIGCHALHVLVAVLWLGVATLLARRGVFEPGRHAGLEMCAIYWYFVCALWVVLFPLVYLA